MIALLRSLAARFRPAPALPPIDQQSYWDRVEGVRRRHAELDAAVAREKHARTSAVGSWAAECVSTRYRASFNPRIVGKDISAWLPGLTSAEVRYIAQASAYDLRHHLFEGVTLMGVRRVQPLEECALIWPKPTLNPEQQSARSGGGPKFK